MYIKSHQRQVIYRYVRVFEAGFTLWECKQLLHRICTEQTLPTPAIGLECCLGMTLITTVQLIFHHYAPPVCLRFVIHMGTPRSPMHVLQATCSRVHSISVASHPPVQAKRNRNKHIFFYFSPFSQSIIWSWRSGVKLITTKNKLVQVPRTFLLCGCDKPTSHQNMFGSHNVLVSSPESMASESSL